MTAYADTQYGSKVIASDRSNYWRYYGLHRDPFMPIVEDSNFFLPVRWEQYFDLLQYLCESTNVLLSVAGVKGSGKTTFMRQFIAQASDNTRICRLVGSTVLTAAQLSKTLIKDFNLPKPAGETNDEQWESLCLSMQSGSQPYLLVIDDAHRLPQESLKVIINLIKQQSEHQMRLHILLIGEMQLSSMLNALKEGESDRELIHTISLESLSLQDTEAYIKHRLVAAGLPGGMPLRPTDIARIFKLSEGVPGRINAVARQALIDVMQQRQLYGFAHFIRTRRTQFLGGAVILIILLALAFMLTRGTHDPALKLYRLLVSEKATPKPVASTPTISKTDKPVVMPTAIINNAETRAINATAIPATTTVTNANATSNNATMNSTPLTTSTINTNTANTNAAPITPTTNKPQASNGQWYQAGMVDFKSPAGKGAATATANDSTATMPATPNLPTVQPFTQTTIKPAAQIQPITSAKSTATPVVSASAIETTHKQTQAPLNLADKLLTLDSPLLSNAKHYTLQLVGVSSVDAVNKFITKNQLTDQAYYYRTNLHGKEWYVVVFGAYPTRQAADNALNTLPEAVHNLHPWPRTMASVQASITRGESAQTATAQPTTTETNTTATASTRKAKGPAIKNTQDEGVEIPQIN